MTDAADAPGIALVLIEDNRLLREGLAALLRAEPDFSLVAATANVTEGLDAIRSGLPGIVLLDFALADHDCLDVAARIRAAQPSARVVITGLQPSHAGIADYVRAGASGFIMKDASCEDFVATIRAVAAGREVLPPALTASLFTQIVHNVGRSPRDRRSAVHLTPRERQVIALLVEGLSNRAIASRLEIAVHTVKSHVHNILEKLALGSRLEVAAFTHDAPAAAR